MKSTTQKISVLLVISVFVVFVMAVFLMGPKFENRVIAKNNSGEAQPVPTPKFDQEAALAKIREQIKGREKEPAGEVFKNIKDFKRVPAGRLLAIMKFGYARSLGVDCTHCHTPDNWAAESKPQKQTAREMHAMNDKINREILPSIKAFEGRTGRDRPVVNCTTCHRGQVKPALNLPRPKAGA